MNHIMRCLYKKIVLFSFVMFIFLAVSDVKAATSDALKAIKKDNSIEIKELDRMLTITPSKKTMAPQGMEFITPWADKPGYLVVTYKNKYDYPQNNNWNRIDIVSRTSRQITKSIDVQNTEYNNEKYWLGHSNDATWDSKEKTLYIMRNLNSSDPNSDIPSWDSSYHSSYSAILGFKFANFRSISETSNVGYFGWSLAYDNDNDNFLINSGNYVYRINNIAMLGNINDRNALVNDEHTYSQVFGVAFPMVRQGMEYYKDKLYYCSSVDVDNKEETNFVKDDSVIYVFNASNGTIKEGIYLPKSLTSSAELEGLGIDEETGQVFLLFGKTNSDGYRQAIIYTPSGKANVYLNANGGTIVDSNNTNGYSVDENGDISSTNKPNRIIHSADYGLTVSDTDNTNTRKGRQMNSTNGIIDYNNPDGLNLKKTGYHVKSGSEWFAKDGNGQEFNQTDRYYASDFCSAIDEPMFKDCDTKLYVNWIINNVKIKYNMNGGSLSSIHGNAVSSSGQNILVNGEKIVQMIEHDGETSSDGLYNYNNENLINIVRPGYHAVKNAEWITADGRTFSQKEVYSASDFCDTSDNDCTVELFVNWKPNKVKIKYNVNGGDLSSNHGSLVSLSGQNILIDGSDIVKTINYDGQTSDSIFIPLSDDYYFNIVKTGYHLVEGAEYKTLSGKTFSDSENYFASDFCDASESDCTVELFANWEVNTYNIGYNLDHGTKAADTPIIGLYDSVVTIPNPTRTGYVFAGWTSNSIDVNTAQHGANSNKLLSWNGSTKVSSIYFKNLASINDGLVTLVSNWIPDIYMVTLDNRGANKGGTDKLYVKYDTDWYSDSEVSNIISKIIVPEKNGYLFDGYYTALSGGTEVINESGTILSNKTMLFTGDDALYAHWSLQNYMISYNLNGGNAANPDSYTVLSNNITLVNPVKEGYTFIGWTGSNGTNPELSVSIPKGSVGNKEFIANYSPKNYTISYNLDGGNAENPIQYNIESDAIILKAPVKEGYTFTGWTGSNGISPELSVSIPKGSVGNKEFVANYTVNKYRVTYNTNGGNSIDDAEVSYGAKVPKPNNPVKDGYRFVNWYGDANLTSVYGFGNMPANDITIYAKWTENENIISYVLNGGVNNVNNPDMFMTGTEVVLLDPSRVGYTFDGWYKESTFDNRIYKISSDTNKDITIYAKWNKISYTIDYNLNGGIAINPESYSIDSSSIELNAPVKEGYIFTGWTGSNGTNPQINVSIPKGSVGNKEFIANYSPKNYTISYNLDGGITENPIQYNIESDAIILNAPVKEGYEFTGWTGSNGTNPQINVSIPKGSVGNKEFIANYSPKNYTISYNLDGGITENPIQYNIESDAIILNAPVKEGYEFTGWTGSNGTNPQINVSIPKGSVGNKEFIANYSPKNYTISYNLDGGLATNPDSYNIDSETIKLNKPIKEGYAFTGWTGSNGTNPQINVSIPKGSIGNKTYVANYEKGAYTITFNSNGGSATEPIVKKYQENISKPDDPTKEGYLFKGWYSDQELTQLYIFSTMPGNNMTLYAAWEKNTYSVSFDTSGGTELQSIDVEYGEQIVKPVDPVKKGYTFKGWYSDNSFTVLYDFSSPVKNNITLYALFEKKSYNVMFDTNGGSSVDDITVLYDETIPIPVSPTKDGYTFVGWITENSEDYVFGKMPSHDVNLFAKWEANTYDIIFDTNGGTPVSKISKKCGEAVSAPTKPTKNGYTFAGWYSDSSLENLYTFTIMPSHDVNLFAKWVSKENVITYVLDGGTNNVNNPATYLKGEEKELLNPEKTGYTFKGWYLDSKYINKLEKITSDMDEDITLYAKFVRNSYVISFDSADGSMVDDETVYQGNIPRPTDPVKEGYTFKGWYLDEQLTQLFDFTNLPDHDITLYAKWEEIVKYTISFDSNGGTHVNDIVLKAGEKISEPNAPYKENYRFAGWYSDKELTKLYSFSIMPSDDIILYASWVSNNDKIISYDLDGGVNNYNNPTYYKVGDEKELLSPTKDGYVFLGWYLDKDYIKQVYSTSDLKDDIVLYARWGESLVVDVPRTSAFISKIIILIAVVLLFISGSMYYYVMKNDNKRKN